MWQPLLTQLSTAHTNAGKTDADRSTAKGTTGPQDELTEKALRALVHLVQAQFPDTWEDVLRGWGWRKTSFQPAAPPHQKAPLPVRQRGFSCL